MSDEMKQELNGLRDELRQGLGELRLNAIESRKDMDDLRSLFRRTMIQVAVMAGDIADIKHELAVNIATKNDISMLNKRMDQFAGFQSDANMNSARTLDRLDDHDRRLGRLESGRA